MFVFGCRPMDGVDTNTKMVSEIANIMTVRFDPIRFSIKFPEILNQLKGEDA